MKKELALVSMGIALVIIGSFHLGLMFGSKKVDVQVEDLVLLAYGYKTTTNYFDGWFWSNTTFGEKILYDITDKAHFIISWNYIIVYGKLPVGMYDWVSLEEHREDGWRMLKMVEPNEDGTFIICYTLT